MRYLLSLFSTIGFSLMVIACGPSFEPRQYQAWELNRRGSASLRNQGTPASNINNPNAANVTNVVRELVASELSDEYHIVTTIQDGSRAIDFRTYHSAYDPLGPSIASQQVSDYSYSLETACVDNRCEELGIWITLTSSSSQFSGSRAVLVRFSGTTAQKIYEMEGQGFASVTQAIQEMRNRYYGTAFP